MGEREFDIELLIKEIHLRPILWDRRNKDYVNKNLKNKAWEDLSAVFYKDYFTQPTRKQIAMCQLVRRKFKSLRDCYQREQNLQKFEDNSAEKSTRRKKYLYFDQLYFLSKSANKNNGLTKRSSRNYEPQRKEAPPNQHIEKDSNKIANSTPKQVINTKSMKTNMVTQIPSVGASPLSSFVYSNPRNNEEDTLFLLSLVKEIKKIPEDSRLSAKIDILQTIKQWQTSSSESQCNGARNLSESSSHERNSTYDCRMCNITFEAKAEQRNHLVKKHIKDGLHVCNVCSAQYVTLTNLELHMPLHEQDFPAMSEKSNEIIVRDEDFDESSEADMVKLELSNSEEFFDE